ncbi:TIGR04219 family outer membrane beta-barrel protein [Opacimonas viscosa]|uniref:TIGR04219 family outer membrane beta-barrel protein n=1 Tax=Opacimonas viscosa TaxID=2961944 RepID=A0AA42BLW5_9ALTE|nr:TIGR04219 family outer membrane beta-barrel protein [Opacimonas viscosa]MCP3429308.1 TIGR04219 family outer membrane beta-barrel protein [Opacimonas viscosa]
MTFSFQQIAVSSLIASTLLASSAKSDTLLGVYAGAQMWAMESTGSVATSADDLLSFAYDDERQSSFYVALEHFVPFVPNAKIIVTTLETDGNTTINQDFTFAGETFTVNAELQNILDLTSTDHILYYEILDNDLVSIDVGINAKKLDGAITVRDTVSNTASVQQMNGFIPMLYSRVELGIPATDISLFAEGSYLAIDDNNIMDVNAALEYRVIDSLAMNMAFQLGYRSIQAELDDIDNTYADIDFTGVYAGVEVHF